MSEPRDNTTLRDLRIGQSAVIKTVGGEGALRQHFLDMGVIPGAHVTLVKYAPLGDPMELRIHGYALTLRLDDAAHIGVTPVDEAWEPERRHDREHATTHPGLGEGGKFHPKGSGDPLPNDTVLSFALVGNQNCGKTTLFNQLTGANQHVGNFPGVTVDRKDGAIRGHANTLVTDLPGIYSMSPYSAEELVSRDFVLKEHPHAIINIVDVTNIERNLYLTMQCLEMDTPMVVALNMMDELTGNGGSVDVNRLESMLGVPVVPICAVTGEGVDELVRHALHVAHFQEKPLRQDFCSPQDNGGAVHRCLHAVAHLIEDHAERADLPTRFVAGKVLEGDELIIQQLGLDQNERGAVGHIVRQMEAECGLDASAAMADMRFSFIYHVCDACVVKPLQSKERERSQRIDRILTGKWTAIPVFVGIMALVFVLTFNVVGAWLQGLMEEGVGLLTGMVDTLLTQAHVNPAIHSLVIEGVFEGVGSVLSFMPIIVVMFFFLSLLEDTGYLARVAFFMDKILRRVGLSGRSIVPMLIGFGCTVPAVMSTRTLPSDRDRRMTILLTPFMSCTAKLPIYAFFVNAFFPRQGGLVMTCLYVLGIVFGILAAILYNKLIFTGDAVPLVLELPNYRMPSPRSVAQLLWEKAKDFLQRAFSVILVATVVVWFLSHFSLRLNMVADQEQSILALISGWLVPLLAPIGLGDWRIATSLVSGFMAKESVVAVMRELFGGMAGVRAALSVTSAACMLVFSLLYTPCVAAIASIRRELGGGWATSVVVWQCIVAWVVAFAVRLIGMLLGLA
ncbi:MAG: ferrous iron transport protein B [Coriobacteriales bacterium]|nr:ferrous iron transport protein B [Coriobacteriales bacterium]